MSSNKKEKKFLKLPTYPGGKEAFRKFIAQNLKYPPEAIEKRIEGMVFIRYSVNGNGDVVAAEVTNGIGHGCDDEAIRIVKLLKFEKAKNRGVRVISSMRTRIEFKLPPQQTIKYEITKKKEDNSAIPSKDPAKPTTYSYSIKL